MRSRKRDFCEVALAERNLFVNRKRNPIKKTEDLRIQSKTPKIFCGVLFYAAFSSPCFCFAFFLRHCFRNDSAKRKNFQHVGESFYSGPVSV
ncbi:hypothetical protein CDAR_213201 [Caerostris darwini]|uniref:Transmembrane protein n=1 Tax=Caerostris darwini TaxID=1538125 RepID=A0AAV4PWI0_9ARAC|nr:hypothetical protein CDAR_213201 [Caerostris darwini]